MNSTNLSIQWLAPNPSFNWFFLLELIVCCILALFFLLYFNRLFATALSYGIRSYTWHYYRAYVDFHAIQFSLLGGRVFFKGARYHGVNESIFIHGGFITWHYWRRSLRRTNLSSARSYGEATGNEQRSPLAGDDDRSKNGHVGEQGGLKEADINALPCRITIKLYGVEWFIYNRTPAYDSILSGFDTRADDDDFSTSGNASWNPQKDAKVHSEQHIMENLPRNKASRDSTSLRSVRQSTYDRHPVLGDIPGHQKRTGESPFSQDATTSDPRIGLVLSKILKLLPMKLTCKKAAIVVGNENTRSVLTSTFDSATGSIEACNAGPSDLYRQVFSFQLSHTVVQLRRNPDYKGSQLAAAGKLGLPREDRPGAGPKKSLFSYRLKSHRIWQSVRDRISCLGSSTESFPAQAYEMTPPGDYIGAPGSARWIGLSRYLDQSSDNEHDKWTSVEYARFSTLLDTPAATVTYYWDIAGRVGPRSATQRNFAQGVSLDINGSPPPEWGADVKLEGGSINYGPWADRERIGLQNVFFPNTYRNVEPPVPLAVGDRRQSTAFKIRVEISEELTLRIPTREQSKDWQWKGRAYTAEGASVPKEQRRKSEASSKDGDKGHMGVDIRPFGWLSLRVSRDSTINYSMDMSASDSGFFNRLSLDLRDSKLLSSVNHAVLWQCPRQLVSCDLSNPLVWNGIRTWSFNVESSDLALFLLRDHILLLTDLAADWSSGPPSDYYTFVPFIYNLTFLLSDFRIFLNVNDLNIISNPVDLDDNRFVVIKGQEFVSNVVIPLDRYKPEQNTLDFAMKIHGGRIDLLSPLWDTLHTFLRDKSAAMFEDIFIDGSYSYYLTTLPDLTDTLTLNIHGVSPKLYMFGFLIRSFMTVKDNYFGDEIRFKTFEEFQGLANSRDQSAARYGINPNRKSNDMDVIMHIAVENPCILLPRNLYDHANCLRLNAPSLGADLRFTNYYMDMQFSLSPSTVVLESEATKESQVASEPQLFIDGVSIHGHRLFGLPPSEPTYVCNWDFDAGRIIGECSPDFLACLAAGLRSYDMSFDSEENALPPIYAAPLYDVTFLRMTIGVIHIAAISDRTAFILSSQSLTMKFNDWADTKFSKRLSLLMPGFYVTAIDRQPAGRSVELPLTEVAPLALLQATVSLKMAQRKSNIDEARKLQQRHIQLHDHRTQRTQWLLFDWEGTDSDLDPLPDARRSCGLHPPPMSIPSMPGPISKSRNFFGQGSIKRPYDTGDSTSVRSFFVASEISSLQSVKRRMPKDARREAGNSHSLRSEINKHLRRRPSADSNVGRHKRSQLKCVEPSETEGGQSPAARAGDPKAWVMPNFSLYKTTLDTSQLPAHESDGDNSWVEATINTDPKLVSSRFEHNTSGVTVSYTSPTGVKGFCTPRFLLDLSSLLEELQPKHPIEIIDSFQKSVISDIVAYEKSMNDSGRSTSFTVRVPFILLRLVNTLEASRWHQIDFRDEYRVGIYGLNSELRTKTKRRKDDLLEDTKQSMAIHVVARDLCFSVEGGNASPCQEKAVLSCHTGDLNLRLADIGPNVRSHIWMREVNVITSTESVKYLAFLVQCTTTMFDYVASSFQHTLSLDSRRLRFLIYSLAQPAASIPDPKFMTRVSYVLRTAPTHLRQHNSWKIISRIRNVFNCISSDQQQELVLKCLSENLLLPSNAKEAVLASFDQWRAWDSAHAATSYAMLKAWGVLTSKPSRSNRSVSLSLFVRLLRLSVDSGPRENDFVVEDLSATVSSTTEQSTPRDALETQTEWITLQSHCSTISLRLRWEILDLFQEIARTMSTITLESTHSLGYSDTKMVRQKELQIVLGADTSSITLDGINVRASTTGKNLRGSLVQKSHGGQGATENLSLILSADTCLSHLSDPSKTLVLWQISTPYMYWSRVFEEGEVELTCDWGIVASCSELRFDVKEDLLGLVYTSERLIEDEVRAIREIVESFSQQTKCSNETAAAAAKHEHVRLYIAVFLDDYQLAFSLLPSFTYIISGEVARASLMPARSSEVEADFDLKESSHTFLSREDEKWHTLSALEIPPINGRVLARILPGQPEIDVDITVEAIHLEASAVRSLLGALTGPKISNLVASLKGSMGILQARLEGVLDRGKISPQRTMATEDHRILYRTRLTMARMGIHAVAPGASDGGYYSADMLFSLGMVRMRLDNMLEDSLPMKYPEFQIDISKVSLELKRRERLKNRTYGRLIVDARLLGSSSSREQGEIVRSYHMSSSRLDVDLFPEVAVLIVDIATHLQKRIKSLDLPHEVKRFKRLRQSGRLESKTSLIEAPDIRVDDGTGSDALFNAIYSLEFNNIQVSWNTATGQRTAPIAVPDGLIFSIKRIDLSNKKKNSAKLRIENVELQMVAPSANRRKRSLNSALMPEIIFNVAYSLSASGLRLAFQAAGKSVDLRATSEFMLPARIIRDSIASACRVLREGNTAWIMKPSSDDCKGNNFFGKKHLRSVLMDIDFAGAVVSLQGKQTHSQQTMLTATLKGSRLPEEKYGQFVQGDTVTTATLRTPGVALKVQFEDNGKDNPVLNAELKVEASTNVLYPALVPLVKQLTASLKEVMRGQEEPGTAPSTMRLQPQKLIQEASFDAGDPSTILGRCKVNLGLLIRKQEFSLSCQPIARVAATARFDSVYVTVNTVQSDEHGRFFSLLIAFDSLGASVKHVYSNESTASFDVSSVIISVMNSKHIQSKKGITAVLRASPVTIALNAKQVQDLMLFHEIWLPADEDTETALSVQASPEFQAYIFQRYQMVASTSAFPWSATIAIQRLEIQLDLGSTLGKAELYITNLWLSSKKTSDREQALYISFDKIGVESKGRMSGTVELQSLRIRTSIRWADEIRERAERPLIQASAAFDILQAKASFDYQPFLVAHAAVFSLLMYNVRGGSGSSNERLFSILEGDTIRAFCTSLTASQSLALYRAWQRLAQDKQAAYEMSLREIEGYLRRKSSAVAAKVDLRRDVNNKEEVKNENVPISLHAGVTVSITTINIGAFPSSLFDNQVFKLEANDAQARFDVSLEESKVHSALGLTLGKLRVALSGTSRPSTADMDNLSVDEVARRATLAYGGTILKVPRLVVRMKTWQSPGSHHITYTFRSTFEGKVDVGWNYSRISFIRDMWEAHSRALSSRLGKPLPPSAVRITGGPSSESSRSRGDQQEKITAVVNMPQSKYMYTALEPPVIETPQLRDMGEATPPLEWIGLQRDKLPNITHQVIIVSLLEIAKEVEDAYLKILGTS